MRLSNVFIISLTFLAAAGLCLVAASFAVTAVEDSTEISVRRALDDADQGWAEVQADGLQVILSGTAPNEAKRFHAISEVGRVVDAARIVDAMDVTPTAALTAPRFSAEILRNESGVTIIGLIPAVTDREDLITQLNKIVGEEFVTDLLETASYPAPDGWEDALGFSVTVLSRLPRSKVSVSAGRIAITAISDSIEEKQALEAELNRAAPPGLRMALDIAAPRPVITPFTLRFLIDAGGARFDACSAETEESRNRILGAAFSAGLAGPGNCTIGMGVPSPNWAKAAELSIAALAELGQGSVTFADADITLVAAQGTPHAIFDRVIGELETALPDVFALFAVLPEPESTDAVTGPPEFTATLSPEGSVQLRGRLSDANLRHVADSYAKARFGTEAVYTATRIVDDLPLDWPVRVLAGLEALSMLSNGAVTVSPDNLTVRGTSERETASADIARLFSEKLGEVETYALDISYRPPPEPQDAVPAPETCEADIAAIQANGKIAFEPGSATIAEASQTTMDAIAEILTKCGEIRMEIQGHTDSQGRESMNQQLSQARAQSVLNELRGRRVLTASYAAVGYGETRPIAENDTDEGREENRRIEFWLIRPDPTDEPQTTLEAIEQGEAAPKTQADTDSAETEPDAANGEESDNEN